MRHFGHLLLAGLFLLTGCNEFQQAVKDAKKDTPPPPKDNYIVLLDLSDRILYNNQQQVAKDIAVVQSIYGIYTAKLDAKDPTRLYYTLHDKLKLLIAPQKTTPKSLYDMVGNLRVDLGAEQPEKKVAVIAQTQKTFDTLLPEIYKQAVIGNNSTAYSGADIWKYFNEDLADDLEKDAQNTLFIITDGYMDLEPTEERTSQNNRFAACSQVINALKKYPDWEAKFNSGDYGLLPVNKKFPGLRVVVLQVNPKEDWANEYALLTKIWGKWFSEMGVTNYRFIKNDNINEVKESLEKFMDVKVAGKPVAVQWKRITAVDSSLLFPQQDGNQQAKPIPPVASAPDKKTSIAKEPVAAATKEPELIPVTTQRNQPAPKKTVPRDDDILKDAAPAKGFNTGIKKEERKETLTSSNRRIR